MAYVCYGICLYYGVGLCYCICLCYGVMNLYFGFKVHTIFGRIKVKSMIVELDSCVN